MGRTCEESIHFARSSYRTQELLLVQDCFRHGSAVIRGVIAPVVRNSLNGTISERDHTIKQNLFPGGKRVLA